MAQVRVIPDLKQMRVNAQKDDAKFQEIVQLVSIGERRYYTGTRIELEGIVLSAFQFRKFRGRNLI